MATIIDLSTKQAIAQSLQSSARRRRNQSIATSRDTARYPGAKTSLNEVLGDLVQRTFGTLFLLIGGALTSTLWLLPMGLPLALFGFALIAAPRDRM